MAKRKERPIKVLIELTKRDQLTLGWSNHRVKINLVEDLGLSEDVAEKDLLKAVENNLHMPPAYLRKGGYNFYKNPKEPYLILIAHISAFEKKT